MTWPVPDSSVFYKQRFMKLGVRIHSTKRLLAQALTVGIDRYHTRKPFVLVTCLLQPIHRHKARSFEALRLQH